MKKMKISDAESVCTWRKSKKMRRQRSEEKERGDTESNFSWSEKLLTEFLLSFHLRSGMIINTREVTVAVKHEIVMSYKGQNCEIVKINSKSYQYESLCTKRVTLGT